MAHMPDSAICDTVIAWYEKNARDLPWRHPGTTPWGVMVSEFMLQQTPVARVLPVYATWLSRWPTPDTLAREPAGEAVRAWGRLGYPRRALRLHQCAVAITQRHQGRVPQTMIELLELPGVGAYTARAIAAFAFGQREPVVDVNIRRLWARAIAGQSGPGATTTKADFSLMESLLPSAAARASRFCAATMELGALVCTARNPRCATCPLQEICAWRGANYPELPDGQVTRRRQHYTGTDRQVRGRLLAILRDAHHPVDRVSLEQAWPLETQRDRALASLLTDGLVEHHEDGRFALPG